MRYEVSNDIVHGRRRNHQPDRPRFLQLARQITQVGGPYRILFDQLLHRLRRSVEDHNEVSSLEKPARHVGAHPAKTYYSNLHKNSSENEPGSDEFIRHVTIM